MQLHCTVLNTVYRKPRPPSGQRVPFSYTDILRASPALRLINASASAPTPAPDTRALETRVLEVDCGEWAVDEIQICEMGSWGPEGEYVRVGGVRLV